jgi:hypothetical protein
MNPFGIVIPGQPATKKNSATMVRNRATLLPSVAYRKYETACREKINMLRYKAKLPHYSLPVQLTCHYWLQDRAHWPDLVGLMQATADIISDERKKIDGKRIVTCRWLLSDDRIITSWDGTKIAGIDKYNPRVEIIIQPFAVVPEEALDPYVIKQLKEQQAQCLF